MATIMARPAAEAVRRRAEEDGIEFFFAQFVDMNAKPSAKLVPMSNFDGLTSEGAGFAGFAAGPIGQTPASPDMMAIPDLRTYTKVPFKPGLARFACDIHVEGEEFPYCPRTILRRQLARAKELGFTFKIGMELEFFLLREKEDGGIELADPLDRLEQPCYDMKGLTRQYEFLSQLSKYVNELGWGSYANDHEDANGQFESNFEFADALETADRAIFFRYMVHAMAQERGLLATFMAKPFGHLTGNGGHFHMSLWDESGQRDLFDDPSDPNGLGLSTLGYHFLGEPVEPMEADPSFHVEPTDTIDSVLAAFEADAARSRQIVAAAPSWDVEVAIAHDSFGVVDLRWIIVHMIEEIARHTGHMDLLREQTDGRTGWM